jgi:16S rRNA (cytidine1402-2'-O)-methyltransferase
VTGEGAVHPGTLFIVSTPIGNLADLSPRAVDTLRAVTLVLAEDTRHSRTLLTHAGLSTPLESYHEHNEARATPKAVARLLAGESVALISDAGTPLLSDPGARLVRAALDAGVAVSPIPGPSALLAGLVGSGLAADRFTFYGFLERKGGDRKDALAEIVALPHTAVVYEAPGRVGALLAALVEAGAGDRDAVVARELTKKFEEFARGTVRELVERFSDSQPRGEVVVLIGGAPAVDVDESTLRTRAQALKAEGASAREVARVLTLELGASRNLAYRIAHE